MDVLISSSLLFSIFFISTLCSGWQLLCCFFFLCFPRDESVAQTAPSVVSLYALRPINETREVERQPPIIAFSIYCVIRILLNAQSGREHKKTLFDYSSTILHYSVLFIYFLFLLQRAGQTHTRIFVCYFPHILLLVLPNSLLETKENKIISKSIFPRCWKRQGLSSASLTPSTGQR